MSRNFFYVGCYPEKREAFGKGLQYAKKGYRFFITKSKYGTGWCLWVNKSYL